MTKKILLTGLLGLLLVPMVVGAQAPPSEISGCTLRHDMSGADWSAKGILCPASGFCDFTDVNYTCGACCVLDTVYTVTDWVFIVVAAVAMIFIFMGAYNIVTAAGDAEKVTSGRNYILYAVVGFIVALLARAIPAIARNVLGM
jgi:hypothetical protein